MEGPDAADIADNTYFLCVVIYHDKDSISCPTLKEVAQKNNTHQKILKMCVSPLFLNLM